MTPTQPQSEVLDVPSGRPPTVLTPGPEDPRLRRLSLNQRTTERWSVAEAIDGCVRAGIGAIGLWREPVLALGLERSARLISNSGLRVSSLCRGGFFTAADEESWRNALDDNRRALDEAAVLGTDCLVLVVGGLPNGGRDLPAARDRVLQALHELTPHARDRGVRLALEPMHPIFCADRGVVSTLAQALDIAEQFPPEVVGVVVDTFHVWWDPQIEAQIARAASRIASLQLADWITPLPANTLLSRGMIGDGHIDIRRLVGLVNATGYSGDIEVEIFNADVWAANGDEVLDTIRRRFVTNVL
jgi:sugar phosphate isomerase/epimerase